MALRQLAILLLTYVVFLTILATLSPFQFQLPKQLSLSLHVGGHDLALNLLLLFPAGFLLSLSRHPPSLHPLSLPPYQRYTSRAVHVLWAGALLSGTLEGLQEFSPFRVTSLIDVTANACGAYLGALLFERLRPWLASSLNNELTIRLPLSHLFYLLTLLLLIDTLMAKNTPQRLWLAVPLALSGAILISAIYTRRLRSQRRVGPLQIALASGVWCGVVGLPGWIRAPEVALWACSTTIALSFVLCLIGFPNRHERRFELPTLVALALPMTLYFAGLFTAGQLPRIGRGGHNDQLVFDAIETLAAFTALGYGVAEALGRQHLTDRKALALTGLLVALLSLIIEFAASSWFGLTPRSWVVPGAGMLSLWGAAIYRAELRVVQTMGRARAALESEACMPSKISA